MIRYQYDPSLLYPIMQQSSRYAKVNPFTPTSTTPSMLAVYCSM